MDVNIQHNKFWLGIDKEMYWPEKETLILSDLHLGKTRHFVENGIQLPELVNRNNYWRISILLEKYAVKRVLLLGDLFHSEYNKEWEGFKDFIENYNFIEWCLVLGNHDILHPQHYVEAGLTVLDKIRESGILFTHEPAESAETDEYNICGHLHPAVRIKGKAYQSLRLPCFYFGRNGGVMPAYGEFTGNFTIKPKKGDRVFVIAENEVIRLS